jgi:hypothetical protein
MSTPGDNLDQVYVLRQTFHPNEPLRKVFSEFVTTGTESSRRFVMDGTAERVIKMADSHSQAFDIERGEADAYLQTKANTHLFLEGQIQARGYVLRNQGMVALRVFMTPQDTAEYASVRGALDLIGVGRRASTPGFDDRVLYVTIPTEQLRPLPEVKRRLLELNHALGDTATRRLYQVTPIPRHMGRAVPRASREPLETAEDESEADEYTESRAS